MTIEWWHIQNNDPMKTIWKDAAEQYMAAHPNVKIKITVLENEAFKSKLTTTMQGGKVPDIFQSWGGGTLKEQADAGLVQGHHRADASPGSVTLNPAGVGLYQVDGKQYGVPFNLGMVGVWYRKSLFEKAGIDAPPATWDEFLADVEKLKAAGITPLAVGEKDKWPGMFWWANLSLRIAGKDAMAKAGEDGSFDSPGFVKAGEELKRLIDMKPFQSGFLAAPWDGAGGEAATIANGKAAMDLMGQWAPSTFAANTKDKDEVLARPRLVPLPDRRRRRRAGERAVRRRRRVRVRQGRAAGGRRLRQVPRQPGDRQQGAARAARSCRSSNGTESSVDGPEHEVRARRARGKASFVQLYLDQAYAPAVGQAVNDAVQELFAGKASPQDVAKQIADAAKAG